MPWQLSGQAAGLRLPSVRLASPQLTSRSAPSSRIRPSRHKNRPFEFPSQEGERGNVSTHNLTVCRRKKVKRPISQRMPLQMARTVNEVWSMDFVRDSLANGWRMKCLTVADDSADRIRRSKSLTHRRASPA